MIYGVSYLFWAIYGTSFDLPAVLGRLVGLGYEVGRATYREGFIHLEPLPGGYAARRVYEDGTVYVLADLQRGAVGVYADIYPVFTRGLAELTRALNEAQLPEPARTEFAVAFGHRGRDCRSEKVKLADVEFVKSGFVLIHGEPQEGEGIQIALTPVDGSRYIGYIAIRGRWQFTIPHIYRINDLINAAVNYLNCSQPQ